LWGKIGGASKRDGERQGGESWEFFVPQPNGQITQAREREGERKKRKQRERRKRKKEERRRREKLTERRARVIEFSLLYLRLALPLSNH